MDQRTLIIITVVLVAIVAVLSLAIVAGLYLTGGNTYNVPIARSDIPANVRIKDKHLKIKEFDDPPGDAVIRDAKQIIGKVSKNKISGGSKIKPGDLTDQLRVVRTTKSIPPGNRLQNDDIQVVGVDDPPRNVAKKKGQVVGKLVREGIPANTVVKKNDVYQSEQKVVMAREQLTANSIIRSNQVRTKSLPSAKVPSDAISKAENVTGRAPKRTLAPGDLVRKSDLFPEKNQLSFFIPLYRRAVSVEVSNYNNVSYLLRPGDRVDLYVYMHRGLSGFTQGKGSIKVSGQPTLQKVADGAEILTLNDVFTQDQVEKIESGGNGGNGGGNFTYQKMTLGVTLNEAEEINLVRGYQRDQIPEDSDQTRFFAILRPRQSDSQYGNRSVNLYSIFDQSLGQKHREVTERISNQVYDAGAQQTRNELNGKNIEIIRGNTEENVMVPRK